MMSCLFIVMIILVIRSVTLDGAIDGLSFYLVPDFAKMAENGIWNAVFAALGQAFFTLSIGIGSLAIFGSYLGKERSLLQESVNVTLLDTTVALVAGLIIFPACFSFGVNPGDGPGLVFVTLPNIFNEMAMGRLWGSLFFVFMSFAALTTIIAVFENILSITMDLSGCSRKKAVIINFLLIRLALFNELHDLRKQFRDFVRAPLHSTSSPLSLSFLDFLFFCHLFFPPFHKNTFYEFLRVD